MIVKDTKKFNDHTWQGLTEGKLMCIARLCKNASRQGDAIANDCYCEIKNFYYEQDKGIHYLLENS